MNSFIHIWGAGTSRYGGRLTTSLHKNHTTMKLKTRYMRLAFQSSARLIPSLAFAATALPSAFAEGNDQAPHGHSHPGSDVYSIGWLEQPGVTGNLGGARDSLEDRGITPYVAYVGEVFTNHAGGINHGTAWSGLLDFGVELNLEKLAGWEGASFFVNAFYFDGNDVSGDRVGDFNAVSNLYTDTRFNLYNIFLQQAVMNDDSFFKIGQIALDDDFMVSETSLLFLNAGFGPMPVESGNTAAPIYALAAPGAVVRYASEVSWFVQGGVYAGDAGVAESNNQGFGWKMGGVAGWMFIAESGYRYGADDACVIKLGGYYHSGGYTHFADGAREDGLYSFYGVIDHQIVRPDGCPGLNGFLRMGIAPQDEIAVVSGYADAGLAISGMFQENDALGLAVSWTELSDDFVRSEGGRSSEIVTELTYQVPIADWFLLQPDIQYIINPQGGGGDAFRPH
jgi:porin